MEIRFKPIGIVHTRGSDADRKENGEKEGELEVLSGV